MTRSCLPSPAAPVSLNSCCALYANLRLCPLRDFSGCASFAEIHLSGMRCLVGLVLATPCGSHPFPSLAALRLAPRLATPLLVPPTERGAFSSPPSPALALPLSPPHFPLHGCILRLNPIEACPRLRSRILSKALLEALSRICFVIPTCILWLHSFTACLRLRSRILSNALVEALSRTDLFSPPASCGFILLRLALA